MHPLAFYQKRAHLCVIAHGRAMFAHIEDMTPARFDILYLLFRSVRRPWMAQADGYAMWQTEITERLGLARQTIWKGVKRLEQLGLVERTKGFYSSRSRAIRVRLTEEGLRRIREAVHAAFSERRPLPKDAPADGPVPRWWRRPELADPETPFADEPSPPRPRDPRGFDVEVPRETLGRDVERIYSAFAWRRRHGTRRAGRRGRTHAHLVNLDSMIFQAEALAGAFGNRARTIYAIRFTEADDH